MNQEIEARFLEVNKDQLTQSLATLGAYDSGEQMLTEVIFYADESWIGAGKRVRLRSTNDKAELTYKQTEKQGIDGAMEIEFEVSDSTKAELFLESVGLTAFRRQEKKRHTFTFDGVTIDIDTWPKIPAYIEIEGGSENEIRAVAEKLGFDWNDAVFDDAREIIQKHYGIPYDSLSWFTFQRCE